MSNIVDVKGIKSVLFVCMGNICRSPTAEAVFRFKAQKLGLNLTIDSAGTISSHAREKPDHRSQKAGIAKGYNFDGIKARQVTVQDFEKFDLILAMDEANIRALNKIAPSEYASKVELFLSYAENYDDAEVPDPYYGGAGGFRYVVELVEDASDGLLKRLSA